MTAVQESRTRIRCDGCGKESLLTRRTAAEVRKAMAHVGWKSAWQKGKLGRKVRDYCDRCQVPEGWTRK